MQINREIQMHLDRKDPTPAVDAVQGETARSVTLALFDKGQPWTVPADASVLIRYRKEDLTGGVYDSLPDGTRAWNIRDNLVDIRIAPQALAVSGVTAMQAAIVAEGEELASFIFRVCVESDPSIGTLASEDYINIGQWLMPRIYQFVSEAEAAAATAVRAAEEALRTAASISSRYDPQYAVCGVDPADGLTMENASAITSAYFPLLGKQLGVAFSPLVTVRLFYYDAQQAFLGADLTRTESFELDIPVGAAFARIEIRYAVGFAVDDPEKLSNYVTVYIPNTSAEDADRAQSAASQALQSAHRAEQAANDALAAGIPPYGCEMDPAIANYSDSELFAVKVKPEDLGGSAETNFGTEDWSEMAATPTSKSAYMLGNKGATMAGSLKSITLQCAGMGNITLAVAHVSNGVVTSVDKITAYVATVDAPCTLVNGVDFQYQGEIAVGDLIGVDLSTNQTNKLCYGVSADGWCYQTTSLTDFTLTAKTYGFAIYATVATGGDTVLTMEKSEDTNTNANRQICYVNFTNGKMGFYNKAADGTALTVYQEKDIAFPLVVGHEYVAEMIKLDSKFATLRLTDACTLESDEITCFEYDVGRGWGARKHSYVENGKHKAVVSAKCYTLQSKKTRLLIVGDSYIEGSALPQFGEDRNNRYAMLMKKALRGDCFINGRGGASSVHILDWFNTYLPHVCQPDYTIVSCGANDSNYDSWVTRYQAIIAKIKEMGSIPILTTVAAIPVSASKEIFSQMNAWIRTSGYTYIDINHVTSLNFEGTELNPEYFFEDNAHPNTAGNEVIFRRAQLDVPNLFAL